VSPAAPPLLFIHGMWSRPRVWAALRETFDAQGHETHAVCLPGHDVEPGDPVPAGLERYGLQDYVDAVVAQARGLSAPPVLIGHSLGGLLAQLAGVIVQPRALVLLSPAPSAAILPTSLEPIRALWPILSRWGFWKLPTLPSREAALWGVFNGVPEAEAEAETTALVHDSGRVLAQLAFPWADGTRSAAVDFARLTCPALVITGDADRITPMEGARATARRLPGPLTYREMAGFGHWIIGRQGTPVVAQHVAAFLAKL
jgi:pimeloyl-ACP methyl ester carboxylesterase